MSYKYESHGSTPGTGLTSVLTLVFVVLKLTHLINWSWWWVFAPVWVTLAVMFLLLVAILIMVMVRK